MKLISLNEWVESWKLLPGRRLLESEEDDVLDNILDLMCTPDPANLELAEQIAKGQFEADNPTLYKKLLALFNHDALKIDGVYFKKIEKTGQGDFNLIFNSTGNVKIPDNLVKNGKLSISFKKVGGKFDCMGNKLTSLEGCPQEVGGEFNCSNNQLTSLEGCPQEVGGGFYCHNNQLTSLEGCPQEVDGDFTCFSNQLTSLEGCPQKVVGNFSCCINQLTSLKGCPQTVGGRFDCRQNSTKFTQNRVRKVCDVNGMVLV